MTLTYANHNDNTTPINNERGYSYKVHCTGSCCTSVLFWVSQQLILAGCCPFPASRHLPKSRFLIRPPHTDGSDTSAIR